jgi:predicted alpha-1,2-mannosidase
MVGSGVVDLGTIGVMPLSRIPTVEDITLEGYASTFSHANETGAPGYYSVFLQTPSVKVEVTATEQVAVHRYTYPSSGTPRVVLFPVSYAIDASAAAQGEVFVNTKANEVHGWMLLKGSLSARFGGYKSYFSAKFPVGFTAFGTWNGNALKPNSNKQNGTKTGDLLNIGAYVAVGSGTAPLEFTVGLSSISVAQARQNIASQVGNPARAFSSVLAETQQLWESQLSRITIQSTTAPADEMSKFYTALYHTLAAPTLFSESGGVYLGFDSKVHNVAEKPGQTNYYTDMSIWDVHRTEFPWLNIFRPDVMSDVVQSLLRMYEQGGELPRWPFLNGYTGCMIGTHSIIVIVDSFLKNVTNGLNVQEAYAAMVSAATQPQKYAGRDDLQGYLSRGWVAYDVSKTSAPETMEYAFDDATLGVFASAIGQNQDAAIFAKRGLNYRNVWAPQQQHMCGRLANGQFSCPLSWLYTFDEHYVEGDGEQVRAKIKGV